MSFSTACTCGLGSRCAISRHSAARSLHFLEVIIGLPQTEHINATTSDFRLDSRKGNPRFSDKLWAGYSHQAFHWNGFWAKETTNMNDARRCLAGLSPRHNPAENALLVTMRDDPNVPCLNSLAAMRHYARQRWPHDPAVQSLMPGLWRRHRRWQWDNSEA
jgi:hypothetical protein